MPLLALSVAGIALFFGIASWTSSQNPNGPREIDSFEGMMAGSDRTDLMRAMMGTQNAGTLPTKNDAERKPSLEPVIKDGVKEFQLSARPIRWEYQTGKTILAWGYEGQVPGPEIRVTEGERVRIVFTNNLPQPTTVHWHGINVPANMDGVPGFSQDPIQPGATFTYEFTATPAGTHFYHTHGSKHGDEAQQLDMGLSGPFIIDSAAERKADREYTLILDDWQTLPMMNGMMNTSMMMGGGHSMNYDIFTINGRAFPETKPLLVKKGERVRLRLVNAATSTFHPMHLHGHQFKIVALDGNPVPENAQETRNTITLHPGETADIEFVADNPGVWLFHCHELHHADGGMIVPIQYEGFPLPDLLKTDETAPASEGGHMMDTMMH